MSTPHFTTEAGKESSKGALLTETYLAQLRLMACLKGALLIVDDTRGLTLTPIECDQLKDMLDALTLRKNQTRKLLEDEIWQACMT